MQMISIIYKNRFYPKHRFVVGVLFLTLSSAFSVWKEKSATEHPLHSIRDVVRGGLPIIGVLAVCLYWPADAAQLPFTFTP